MPISTDERKRRDRERQRRRYANDPEWRERKKAKMREYVVDPSKRDDPAYLEKQRAKSRRAKQAQKRRVRQLVAEGKNAPCVDCGNQYEPFNMEYDHVRGVKSFGLGQAANSGRTVGQTKAEIAKCEIRCVMCHRRRHLAAAA